MKKRIVLALVDWLLKKFAPEWHRHKNPVRSKSLVSSPGADKVRDAILEGTKRSAYLVGFPEDHDPFNFNPKEEKP